LKKVLDHDITSSFILMVQTENQTEKQETDKT